MNKKIIIGAIILVILIVIGVAITIYVLYKKKIASYTHVERQDSNGIFKILDDNITPPKDGINYSMTFFMYLNDYSENFKYWKHVLHKGTEMRNTDVLNYTDWNELVQDIPSQSPGLWFNPKNTMLRISFTTRIDKDFCKLNTVDTCSDKKYCEWTGSRCISNDAHGLNMGNEPNIGSLERINVEFVDIEIPYKKMTHIGFVLENQVLNIYYNGKLRKVHKFMGVPIFNNNHLHFNIPNTFNGSIFNFNYIPLTIDRYTVEIYSKDIPNVNLIPKSRRITNYVKRLKFNKALQSIFI
tara:strand:- start:650 stop:1540 length:891 start_codon:yes stop_codon:yes gene_type:complete